jgi:hypothetical protein
MNFCGNRENTTRVLFQVLDYYLKMGWKDIGLFKDSQITNFMENARTVAARCQATIKAIEQLQEGNPAPARELLHRLFEVEVQIASQFEEMPRLQLDFLKPAVTYGRACLELSS